MLRTELFREMKTWSTDQIKEFTIRVLFPMEKERVLDAIFTVARSQEINEALEKIGKAERLQ
jgi:hypothetical protein